MSRESVKAYYRSEDARRTLQEPTFRTDVEKIRSQLRNLLPGETILYKCFNDIEVEIIKEDLTPEELSRVKFSWMVHK